MSILNRIEASVDLERIEHNFFEIRRFTGGADMICVIKADAYGHGAVKLGLLYEKLGAEMLAVACLDEALELRRGGISLPVLILGATPVKLAYLLAKNGFVQAVSSLEYAKELDAEMKKLSDFLSVHIKLDTGMSRFGLYAHNGNSESAADEAEDICRLSSLRAEGIFTHFSEAESTDASFTDEQFEAFMSVVEKLRERGKTFKLCHCANSAAVVNYKKAHLKCVRPGLILYGYSPTGEKIEELDLLPAMTLRSLIADIRKIRAGDSISYNRNFIAERDMTVAVVSCGYADGLPRSLSNRGYFLIGGKRAPILGNVCMDLTVVDVSDIEGVAPFDEAVIFGSQEGEYLAPEELAALAGTISYELLTSVSKRVPRTYSGGFA